MNLGKCYIHTSSNLRNEVREIKVPTFPESISEGDLNWSKAVGDSVVEDEEIGQVETDKTNIPVLATAAGVIEELLVEDGATVTPGLVVCKVRVGAEASAPKAEVSEKTAAPPSETVPSQTPATDVSSPPPTTPPPIPPKPTAPLSSKPVSSIKIPVIPMPLPPGQAESTITDSRTETKVKLNRMRQRIAQRLKEAQNTYAMLTTFNEVDMSNVIEMRNKHKDAFLKKHNIKLGFMSAFVKAAAYALHDQPVVNAVIDEEFIVYRNYIDISVAVATPKGLVVPVIRNLGKMNYADIEKAIHALGEKARTGTLAIEDMDGGTFTISNGGVFGSLSGTPIINPPQSAILGMHAIKERPVVINGKIEIRPMMNLALTYDHRLIDGREAVGFLIKIKSAVEDPRIMLMDL
ncbi:dihydrolipoyllysine-residue succinyltransferase component of 2-oxoglutarate dehydrogenase complex, mitochondrial [Parasteatoda tepidariorum]|uniref:dihydrolipoyllysine-residue succinyltransferase component of 2-oxoglutarate dehydrogenase complex, mitochondrial n=1 Tax=Parasteatoda tepidariorum TaxID=114398 RepID=UPI001C718812|nr:dihydrolipoyllysine-residue succinyltransferase component of 2-oxoglutarate dehydrogenase complex, mitochondrial [Parasteatoda tepidariorum]